MDLVPALGFYVSYVHTLPSLYVVKDPCEIYVLHFIEPQSRAEPGYGKPHRHLLAWPVLFQKKQIHDPPVDLPIYICTEYTEYTEYTELYREQKEKEKNRGHSIITTYHLGARTW